MSERMVTEWWRKFDGRVIPSEVEIVVDPDLDKKIQKILRGETSTPRLKGRRVTSKKTSKELLVFLAGAFAPLWVPVGGGIWKSPIVSNAVTSVSALCVTVLIVSVIEDFRDNSRRSSSGGSSKLRRKRRNHPDGSVRPEQLNDKAVRLLKRAQEARKTVLNSAVHAKGHLDKDHNEAAFPTHEWQIAKALLAYTKGWAEIPAEEPTTRQLDKAVNFRIKNLEKGLSGVYRRVKAMEKYARQVEKLDAQQAEIEKALKLTEGDQHILDLLAFDAADDMALAELEGLTEQARILSEKFRVALEETKGAAVIALPMKDPA